MAQGPPPPGDRANGSRRRWSVGWTLCRSGSGPG